MRVNGNLVSLWAPTIAEAASTPTRENQLQLRVVSVLRERLSRMEEEESNSFITSCETHAQLHEWVKIVLCCHARLQVKGQLEP